MKRKMSDAHRMAISKGKLGKPLGKVKSRQKTYRITSPAGMISFIESSDLPNFFRKYGLSYPTMMRHVKSKKPHKGWNISIISR